MPRRKTSSIDEIRALPNTKVIDGKPYVRVCYRGADGKWKEKCKRVSSVEEAIRVIANIQQQLGQRGPDAFVGERMTFTELLAEYQKAKQIPRWYAEPMEQHFGQRRVQTITYGDIQRFKATREQVPNQKTGEPRSPTTINRELEWLRAALLYAVRHEWLARNPFTKGPTSLIRKSEEEPRSRIPSPEEEARIMAQCVGPREHLRPILIAARDTGLRKGALLALTWSVVDLTTDGDKTTIGDFLKIPAGNRYKRRPKKIGITARLKAELLALWEKSDKDPAGNIFGGIKSVKRSYDTACRKAGVEDLRFHDWRHGFATDLMEAGVEERLAMIAAGHTSAEMHAIYTNVDERLARMIAGKLDELHATRKPAAFAGGEESEPNEWIN